MDDNFPIPQPSPVSVPASAAESPSPPQVETSPTAPAPEPSKVEEDDVHTLPKGVQRRIDRAVRQRYEAEARAKIAEEELSRFRQQPQAAPPETSQKGDTVPTIDKFDNIEDYVAAKAKWIAREEIRGAFESQTKHALQQRAVQEREQLTSSWTERVVKAAAEIPDFEDVISASTVPMTPPMERAVLESEVGPKLAYWLANNPDEAVKIAQMSPTRAFVALGRIEEKLITAPPPVPKPSNAPPPIEPAGSRANVSKNPDDMTTEEWMAWRRKQINSR